jgi:hypothetical protein
VQGVSLTGNASHIGSKLERERERA